MVEFGYTFCDHSESVWKCLDFGRKDHSLPSEADAPGETQPAVVPPPAAPVDYFRLVEAWARKAVHDQVVSAADLDKFLGSTPEDAARWVESLPQADGLTAEILRQMIQTILSSRGRWFYWAQSEPTKNSIKRLLPVEAKKKVVCHTFLACFVMQALGLGKVVSTVDGPGGGRRNWLLLKRPVTEDMHAVLAEVGYSPDTTPSLQSYIASILNCQEVPPRAPATAGQTFPRPAATPVVLRIMALLAPVPPTQPAAADVAQADHAEPHADQGIAFDNGGFGE